MGNNVEKKLQVRHLQVSFRTNGGKVQAVRDISFDLHKGETLAIVGESGSGKSVTSKAILGIQAGNAIVEGGEILYDGQDLLKISEEDFYRLRGDKISMIFQDPLSSLNPIMRIGKQLTEAMLLKGKARQRACKANFERMLKLLCQDMLAACPNRGEEIKSKCATFHAFVHKHTAMEQAYNRAHEAAEDALTEAEHQLHLINNNGYKDDGTIREVRNFASSANNEYLFSAQEYERMMTAAKAAVAGKDVAEKGRQLQKVQEALHAALAKERPDFFAMGYFMLKPKGEAPTGSIKENNAFYHQYLAEDFMYDFLELAQKAIAASDERFHRKRETVIEKLEAAIANLETGTIEGFKPLAEPLCKAVMESINQTDVIKDSAACTFAGSLNAFMARYQEGVKTNSRKEKKYQRELHKYEVRAAKGKDWKVALPTTIDLELVRSNMISLMQRLRDHYVERNQAENQVDIRRKADGVIDYLKENASGSVLKVTKQLAKNRALKLMAEVGIPEPRKRYRNYPFEFSGGMRQRIVIAIALAADPDILICDEPTTALDVTIQAQILELINKLKAERNLSIIFITHDLGVVANMADSIAVMYAGKIVEYGKAEEIFYSPAHPYTWALLSSMPDLDTKEKLEAIPGTPPNMIYPPKGDAFADRNRYAMEIDFEQQPPAFPITDTHWAATWLLHPKAPHVDPPKTVTDRIAKMKARTEVKADG